MKIFSENTKSSIMSQIAVRQKGGQKVLCNEKLFGILASSQTCSEFDIRGTVWMFRWPDVRKVFRGFMLRRFETSKVKKG